MRHVDDFAGRVPDAWHRHGGVLLPMYQSEALWIRFSSGGYPFAVKIGTGKVSAVTGETWKAGLHRNPQDYVVVPGQPWLDGYVVQKGVVRQFVAMPLGEGYSAEEQITGAAEHGGLQVEVYPLQAAFHHPEVLEDMVVGAAMPMLSRALFAPDMGLAPGGRMRQEIYDDDHEFDHWDTRTSSRCFVHLANSMAWRAITGDEPPTVPFTAKEYRRAGIPWFDYYADGKSAVDGSSVLEKLKSVAGLASEKSDVLPSDAPSFDPGAPVQLKDPRPGSAVREGTWE
jgi:hypothetical protein